MSAVFKFKQFQIRQDNTAMKVGTDGVLLGAWVAINEHVTSVLDIGTGTGLIALQIAQRSDCELIDALEIEPDAYEQAVANFENSDWADRLFCYHASLQEFTEEIDEKYDLIISNPPFYNATYKALETNRALARHTESLTFEELLHHAAKLLSKSGSCAFIIPFEKEENFLQTARQNNLFAKRITRVKGNVNTAIKRSLLQLSFENNTPIIETIAIEIERHLYTETYKEIVQDFYVKM